MYQFNIRGPIGDCRVMIEGKHTVQDLLEATIANMKGLVDGDAFELAYEGMVLDTEATIDSLGIFEESWLDFIATGSSV